MNGTCNSTIFEVFVPWGRAKRSNIFKSQLQSQFQRFLKQTFCVFSQMKDIKHNRQDFHSVPWVMPQGLGLWDAGGGQNFIFLNMVIWHIKLKGLSSRLGYTEKFYPTIKLVILGWGQIPLGVFESVGICNGAPSNVF